MIIEWKRHEYLSITLVYSVVVINALHHCAAKTGSVIQWNRITAHGRQNIQNISTPATVTFVHSYIYVNNITLGLPPDFNFKRFKSCQRFYR